MYFVRTKEIRIYLQNITNNLSNHASTQEKKNKSLVFHRFMQHKFFDRF